MQQVSEEPVATVVALPDARHRHRSPAVWPAAVAGPAVTHPVFGGAAGAFAVPMPPASIPDAGPDDVALRLVDVPGEDDDRTPPDDGLAARDQEGSLVTEYGLLAIVAATIAGVVIQWASGGAIVRLFNALLNAARDLVGAG